MGKPDPALVTRSAERFCALGAEPRLQILRLLLAAHPAGMVVSEVPEELGISCFYALAPSGKAQAGGPREGAPRGHLSLVFRPYRSPDRNPEFSL